MKLCETVTVMLLWSAIIPLRKTSLSAQNGDAVNLHSGRNFYLVYFWECVECMYSFQAVYKK